MFYPFKIYLVDGFIREDFDRCIEYSDIIINKIKGNDNLICQ